MQAEMNVVFSIVLFIGSLFLFLAAAGSIKFPDFFTRMAAISKAGTLGAACLLMSPAAAEPSLENFAKGFLALIFLFLSAPVAAHLLGRAGYRHGAKLLKSTQVDKRYKS